jgi:hypothetical protein
MFLFTYSVLLLLIAGLIHGLNCLPSVNCLCWKLESYSRYWTAYLLSPVFAESWQLIRVTEQLICCRLFVVKAGCLFAVLNGKPSVYCLCWKLHGSLFVVLNSEQLTCRRLFVLKACSLFAVLNCLPYTVYCLCWKLNLIRGTEQLTCCRFFVVKAGSLFAVLNCKPSVNCLCWKLAAYSRDWTAYLLSTVCDESWQLNSSTELQTFCRLFVLKAGSFFAILNNLPSVYCLCWKLTVCTGPALEKIEILNNVA